MIFLKNYKKLLMALVLTTSLTSCLQAYWLEPIIKPIINNKYATIMTCSTVALSAVCYYLWKTKNSLWHEDQKHIHELNLTCLDLRNAGLDKAFYQKQSKINSNKKAKAETISLHNAQQRNYYKENLNDMSDEYQNELENCYKQTTDDLDKLHDMVKHGQDFVSTMKVKNSKKEYIDSVYDALRERNTALSEDYDKQKKTYYEALEMLGRTKIQLEDCTKEYNSVSTAHKELQDRHNTLWNAYEALENQYCNLYQTAEKMIKTKENGIQSSLYGTPYKRMVDNLGTVSDLNDFDDDDNIENSLSDKYDAALVHDFVKRKK